jgi:hypothetical protein
MITAGRQHARPNSAPYRKNSLLLSISQKWRTKTASEKYKELKSQQVCEG